MTPYYSLQRKLLSETKVWLITGVAGFIGSNLLESLLNFGQKVIGLDNFSTGKHINLEDVRKRLTKNLWSNFTFIEGDIRNIDDCTRASCGVDYILHQAALGSVPRSLKDPITTNSCNIDGFLNMLVAGEKAKVQSFVYAASSSTYGDHPDLPKIEDRIGKPLSPYAVTKLVNELYAEVFYRCYGFQAVGLRYFNVFGKRQDPMGDYAAVIPKWISAIINNESIHIYGDGETSRDFCFIDNIVQANLLAATTKSHAVNNQIYNIALGHRTTLNDLYRIIKDAMPAQLNFTHEKLSYKDFRAGDVRHSQADISKAKSLLGYTPSVAIREGIAKTIPWYFEKLKN